MDSAKCNVVYVDRNARENTILDGSTDKNVSFVAATSDAAAELRDNLDLLVNAFGEVHITNNGAACVQKLFDLHDTSLMELKPTLVLIDLPYDEESTRTSARAQTSNETGSASERDLNSSDITKLYGLRLLERIVYESHSRNLSKLIVPIPVVSFPLLRTPPPQQDSLEPKRAEAAHPPYAKYLSEAPDPSSRILTNRALLRKCLDVGAIDVMASPLHMKTLATLEVHAYRAHKEAGKDQQAFLEIRRGRKRSWVGMHDEKPFSYLREAMVSGLMSNICQAGQETEPSVGSIKIEVSPERRDEIRNALGQWHFCAHELSDDDLVIGASLMFQHAFTIPELDHWRISTDQLTAFLVACRAAYNTFVPFHNFRHAVDVLQATFHFLVNIGTLPPFLADEGTNNDTEPKSPLASLLKPFEALTLLVSAIGHDVGHPGVNNGFLITLNAPLAQLYNDRSVLESFHCAAYSQILRRYWPGVFDDTKMRSLMISTILATDMGLHFDYMKKLGDLQERLQENNSVDGWNGRMIEEQTAFACSLLIKCADISNVARKHDTALQWMYILCDEFSRQASMEAEIGIPSSLISPPKKDFLSLAKAQLGFMNMFAIPLFQGVADVLPLMQYTVEELEINKVKFENDIENLPAMNEERQKRLLDGTLSPRSMSIAQPELNRTSSFGAVLQPFIELPEHHAEIKEASRSPPDQANHVPNVAETYKEMNGVAPDADSVTDYAPTDSYSMDQDSMHLRHNGKQRRSETTEGSSSVPCSGDWQSQVTSATTGRMPMSPSTQGTSIRSQASTDHDLGLPTTTVTGTDGDQSATPRADQDHALYEDDSNGHTLRPDRSLRKKTSRFRMNAMAFFRRKQSPGSPSSGHEPAT
ncbi:3'5'-cyclic nucleotide phosphodiesterase [Microdochium trichocladiopsis]|uniref:Phosphodiesterase n=1 Tax=Microdochium trichocladiopsis TaxID=1682393 RepID=A0A9P8YES0_9PEZI|nr:3'5'-cyclic nucleotide phosphodiesterase [Microdochium trichocladiopsis]KAH7037894.1 3'5'-cyclic nucleotide phosphodiesterase [Microdochium trichocladiopsis]